MWVGDPESAGLREVAGSCGRIGGGRRSRAVRRGVGDATGRAGEDWRWAEPAAGVAGVRI